MLLNRLVNGIARSNIGRSVLKQQLDIKVGRSNSSLLVRRIEISNQNNLVRLISDYRFSEKHEWIVLDKSDKTIGTVGISQYAQEALGDVVYVQLPEIDSDFDQDVGAIESVKAANEIYTPVSGKIIELNENLSEKPNLVNTSCYEEGWLFKIKLKNSEEYEKLMDQKTYDEFLKQSAA
ncbi:Glycine cleavage system H protein [Sarcoptes scabiei]|nr:Glycine cleavage system H protein [Sarcoptes scabiei]